MLAHRLFRCALLAGVLALFAPALLNWWGAIVYVNAEGRPLDYAGAAVACPYCGTSHAAEWRTGYLYHCFLCQKAMRCRLNPETRRYEYTLE